ncbi:MAG: GIY-YIG nuclease family protein [Aestuariivirga sp.]
MADFADEELLAELGVEVKAEKPSTYTAKEERIIAGFEDIQRFVDEHKRPPQHGEGRDIFERLYAVRLDRIRELPEARLLLGLLDRQGLLDAPNEAQGFAEPADDNALLAELGVATASGEGDDIHALKHVRSNADKKAAEDIANRTRCEDFEQFKPLFVRIQKELEAHVRETRVLQKDADEISLDQIKLGAFFVVGGQKAYIADMGRVISGKDRRDARLRVIYDNGTEADVLMRSFQRSLYRDESSRLVTEPAAGPLFASVSGEDDIESGTVYVLRSKSDHPAVAANRDLIHKIGVTGGTVETRISHAALDATYLLADVEVIATYDLFNINRTKLENLIHRFFEPARLDLEIKDRFGNPVRPREWFLVPLQAINEAVERIKDGSISEYRYDSSTASLKKQ